MRRSLGAVTMLALCLPLPVSAQSLPQNGPEPAAQVDHVAPPSATVPAPTSAEMTGAINSDDLIGKRVKNNWDQTVGSIDALLVSHDARVVGVVLDVGGFLGLGGKKVVVPMSQLSMVSRDDVRIATGSKEQLQQALAYEKPKS